MKFFKQLSLFGLIAGCVQAQAAWYQVEVIVFEHLRPSLAQEVWFENPGIPSRMDTIELISGLPENVEFYHINNPEPIPDPEIEIDPEQGLVPYMALDESYYHLRNDYRILRLSAEYRPLIHLAWQQPGFDRQEGRAIHLESVVDNKSQDEELPPELADIQIVEDIYQAPEMIFDGNIRLRTTQYLHLEVDMSFFPTNIQQILQNHKQRSQNAESQIINTEADYVRLTESRRVKLNELHYFDHPLFGVLVQVSRLNLTD